MSRRGRSAGEISRRGLLRAGVLGLGGLGLADLLRIEAAAAAPPTERSVILIWLDGGPPQHETYDPKPDAPSEFRGPLGAIPTTVPGVLMSELLPRQAALMDRISLLRSVHHDNGDHFAAAHWMLTGFLGSNAVNQAPVNPSMGSVVAKLKGPATPGVPAYVGLPNTHSVGIVPGYHGGAFLGSQFHPFNADGDPNTDGYRVQGLNLPDGLNPARLGDRRAMLGVLDTAWRDADVRTSAMDAIGRKAFDLVTSPAARRAFDPSKEGPRLRDRYGRHTWGQSALLARRLVEAGVRFVTLTYSGWDYHSSLEKGMQNVLPVLDAAVATLIEDLDGRGLLDRTMVIVMGEFGRTPRMNTTGVPGADPVPGRDHWGNVMSVLIAGGGVQGGRVVGRSNPRGEVPVERPLVPQDVLATVYRQLGVDPDTTFLDRQGRPVPILATGRPIEELF